ncbi:MAG: hypothetical protein SO008_00780 [Bacteroidaceae bacterium]|nr:hypothetical protein [Bacteroidaceae bacterium]
MNTPAQTADISASKGSGKTANDQGKGEKVAEGEDNPVKEATVQQRHTEPSNDSGHSIGSTDTPGKVASERQSVNTEPTEGQKEAGNYKKGHIKVDGFDITIENPKGSTRSGTDASGKAWSVPMHYDYGYIKGTEGVDGDHIDVYLSEDPTKGNVYVVDQINQNDGSFDEHKVMYGFPSMEAAVEAYKGQYEDGWKVGTVTEVSREDFKKWVESSKRKTKPFADYKSMEDAAKQQRTEPSGKEKPGEKEDKLSAAEKQVRELLNPYKESLRKWRADGDPESLHSLVKSGSKIKDFAMSLDPDVLEGLVAKGVFDDLDGDEKNEIEDLPGVRKLKTHAFEETIRKQGKIEGQAKPAKKTDPFKFVLKGEEVQETPAMAGKCYTNGYEVCSDGYVLIAVKSDYPKEKEGIVEDKKGNRIEGKYPHVMTVVKSVKEKSGRSVKIDVQDMRNFLQGVLDKAGKKGTAVVSLRMPDGMIIGVEAKNAKLVLDAMDYYGIDTLNYSYETKSMLAANDKASLLITPVFLGDGYRNIEDTYCYDLKKGEEDKRANFHKAESDNSKKEAGVPVTEEEAALRDELNELLREAGMPVIDDVEGGQQVLDMANGDVHAAKVRDNLERGLSALHAIADGAEVVPNAMTREDISQYGGDNNITFYYGKTGNPEKDYKGGYGIAHIGGKHGANTLIHVLNVIANGRIDRYQEGNKTLILTDGEYEVVLGLTRFGNKETWLFNGWKKDERTGADGEVSTPSDATQANPTFSRTDLGAILSDAKIQKVLEDAVKKDEKVHEQRVYHGSGAEFDHFDTMNHMGEGEGSQAFGAGTYVSDQKGLGLFYAKIGARDRVVVNGKEYIFGRSNNLSVAQNIAAGALYNAYHGRSGSLQHKVEIGEKDYVQRAIQEIRDTLAEKPDRSDAADYIEAEKLIESGEVAFKHRERVLYTVEIPDDNGKNYLDWDGALTREQADTIRKRLYEAVLAWRDDYKGSEKELAQDLSVIKEGSHIGDTYGTISDYLGSDKAASDFLHHLGYTGIKVHAAHNSNDARYKDKWNYVIFNDKDLKITDKVKFFRTANGEAYGFTVGGKIYIDPRIATSETSIHEYTHLWAEALRKVNPKEWQNVVKLMKGTWAWDYVKRLYPELKTDDEIAEESLAHYSGRRGAERLREAAREEADKAKGVMDKAAIWSAFAKIKDALGKFWKHIAEDFLHIHFTSAEEVADKVMYDLLSKVKPGTFDLSKSVEERVGGNSGMRGVESSNDGKLAVTRLPSNTQLPVTKIENEGGVSVQDATRAVKDLPDGVNTLDGYHLTISRATRNKLNNEISNHKDDKAVLTAMCHIDEIVGNSILIEEHRDRIKKDGVRSAENKSDPNIEKTQRFYGAITIDGVLYRVKSTAIVYKQGNNRMHSYEITKIELLPSSTPTARSQEAAPSNNSISLAKLLKNVEFSYEKGKKLLDEIDKNDGGDMVGDVGVRYMRKPYGGNSGYVGYSKSRRAVDAEGRGLRNKSQMDGDFCDEVNGILAEHGAKKVSLAEIKRSLDEMVADEWHHTSMYGNKTKYYSAERVADYFMGAGGRKPAERVELERRTAKAEKERRSLYEKREEIRRRVYDEAQGMLPIVSQGSGKGVKMAYKGSKGLYVAFEGMEQEMQDAGMGARLTNVYTATDKGALRRRPWSWVVEHRDEVLEAVKEKRSAVMGAYEKALPKYQSELDGVESEIRSKDAELDGLYRKYGDTPMGDESARKSNDDALFRLGDGNETFAKRQRRAVENKGTVAPGLNSAEVKVVDVPKHDFTGTGKQAIDKARVWAEQNLVGLHTAHRDDGNTYDYQIDDEAVGKYLSSSSTMNSDNLGVHLAVLKKLPEVIDNSIEAEEHPDYKKVKGERSADNGVADANLLVHRMYGAVNIDGNIYRVKTTMHEHLSKGNAPHDYRVTKVELLISGSATSNALSNSTGSHSPSTVTAAKLLQNVEKEYDKGKKLLDESKKDENAYRDGDVGPAAKGTDAEVDRVTELSERLHTPVRIIRTEEEVAALPSVRQRRMKKSSGRITSIANDGKNTELTARATSEDDTKLSKVSENDKLDAEYLQAVKDGDMDNAQRMVDAKYAEYVKNHSIDRNQAISIKSRDAVTYDDEDKNLLFREDDARDAAQRMDENNGTEVVRFVDFLRRGRLKQGESRYFHVGETGGILNEHGISGKITIGTSAVNSHHNEDADHLDENDWVEVIEKINEPVAITEYGDRGNSYRIYTIVEKNGKNICVGVDVNSVGRDVNITNIRTAFARDIANALNERLVYPHSRTELETAIRELSLRHNREVYPEQPYDAVNIRNNSETQENDSNAMVDRVTELSERLHTPVRIIRTEEEVAALPSVRQRRMKGSFNPMTGDVTIVVPNNANMADVENTVVHEVVGHDGLRVLFPDEAKRNNALDELYRVSNVGIQQTIDRMAQKTYDAEVDRLREKKRREHEAKGEDANASYYADMAEAHAEANKKREKFKRDATEEYGAKLAGRIGESGFEKMSADELKFWGKLRAMLQKALQRLLDGLKIPGRRKWSDKEWAFVLHEAYKRKKNGGHPTVFDAADTEVMRRKTGFGESKNVADEGIMFRDGDMGLEETITKMKVETSQANADNWQTKQDAMRAIGGNLNKLRLECTILAALILEPFW